MLEKSKREYYAKSFRESTSNTKQTWKKIHEITSMKQKNESNIKMVQSSSGELISDPEKIPDYFNSYFANIGSNLSSTFRSTTDTMSHIKRNNNTFYLKPITPSEISNHIREMDSSKSVRPGDPPIKFLKIASAVISPVLSEIFNLCISQSVFPIDLKIASVIPIHKGGDKTNCGNSRPISVLSPFSKIFEKCIYTQLNKFFLKHSILSSKQFGFKQNTSTEMALSVIQDYYTKNIENGEITGSVFLDISKAFDTVDHKILLTKLNHLGVRGLPLNLLKNYLTDRSQYTSINGFHSSRLPLTIGVPQGSVLGPFLFSVQINDISVITKMFTTMFADDACLSYSHRSIKHLQVFINEELRIVQEWMNNNKLKLNVQKTNFMLIHNRKTELDLTIQINDFKINRKSEIKYLGVIMDEKLSWKPHINYVKTKLSKCIWATFKLRPYTDIKTLKLLYYALGFPNLQYCISIWGGASRSALLPLIRKQKILVRSMLFQDYCTPSIPLFNKLQILNLDQIYKFRIGLLMFKNRTGKINMPQQLHTISEIHNYNTRSSNNYYIPKVRLDVTQKSYSYCGPMVWNNIPLDIRSVLNEATFKQKLRKYLMDS